MGRTRKSQHTSLGKSLIKKNKAGWDAGNKEDHHHEYTPREEANTLKSVTDESPYEEFIATAALAAKDFTADKLNIKFVSLSTAADDDQSNYLTIDERKLVSVPRRPKWTSEMSAEELNHLENEAFLTWRRRMAQLQNKDGITPFERNIEVWRQLWRVVERSDIVVQIVDARNPLLYRCEDLENYVKELGKTPVLLINKADYLNENQRRFWSEYFTSIGLAHGFYSAQTVKMLAEVHEKNEDERSETSYSDTESEDAESNSEEDSEFEDACENPADDSNNSKANEFRVLGREELVNYLKSFKPKKSDKEFNVGLVGYPNVGKSSTINSLMGFKKTSVSSTPGKTKHFQTLVLEEDLILCDCPGLVMPAFGGSKGEMVLGGILPIDQLSDHNPPVAILARQIPRPVFQYKYGVTLPEEFDHLDLLSAYAAIRGFMTVRGLPDNSRAARIILKDYVNGKLIYCHSPPQIPQDVFLPQELNEDLIKSFISADTKKEIKSSEELTKGPRNPPATKETNLDKQFFTPQTSSVHVKGKQYIPSGLTFTSTSSSSTGISEKPWRKHNNKNKKEKLRRVYRQLDEQ